MWILVRVVLIVAAVGALALAGLFVTAPSGTMVDATGAVVDLVARAVLIACAITLWRGLRGARSL